MKNKDDYAVAVRKPDGQIEVQTDRYVKHDGKGEIFLPSIYPRRVQFCSIP